MGSGYLVLQRCAHSKVVPMTSVLILMVTVYLCSSSSRLDISSLQVVLDWFSGPDRSCR